MKRCLLAITLILVFSVIAYAALPRPELNTFVSYSNVILDNKDNLLKITLADDDRYRIHEKLNNVSPKLIAATILYEDQHYYSHRGVDYLALIRAFWVTYVLHGRRVGASTIAMQVARLRWNIASHTFVGKIMQILRAIQLTRHYSKNEILNVYLNMAPYGRNIEGIAAASLIYFNKKPSQLSLPEALTLAVIPQNPNKRNPTTNKGYNHLSIARSNLLKRWLDKYPDDSSKEKLFSLKLNVRAPEDLPFVAPHFVNFINERQPRWQKGYIPTTLNRKYQQQLDSIIKSYVSEKKHLGIHNAAALLINYQTMELLAMSGSADYYNDNLQGQVNGVLAKRSPGSTLKPFVYALAMDEGLVHPMTLMKDAQRRFAGFTPENYDRRFLGPIIVRDALIQSRNVPAVTLQSKLKKFKLYDFLKQADIKKLKKESYYGLALGLGGAEVSMLELVKLYSTLANLGQFKNLNALREEKMNTAKTLLSAESAFLVLDILKDNSRPDTTGFSFDNEMKNDVAWKTGTSWAYRDAWAVGVSGPYVLAVWIGNFKGEGNDAFVGRSAAGPLMFSVLDAIFPSQGWKVNNLIENKSLNLKKVKVCKNTGDLYSKHCPVSAYSWFIPGVSPIKVSDIYRSIPIENATGLRACWHQPGKTKMQVFEFWSSDFLQLFQQAGISLKTPPKFSATCNLDQKSSTGQLPVIRAPQATLKYVIRSDNKASQKIPFSAVVDSDVEQLYWFVSDKYVGSSKRGEAFIWNAISGNFVVRVVDDAGRAASVLIDVLQLH